VTPIPRIAALLALAALLTVPLGAPAQNKTIRVGVTPGPHAQIMDQVAQLGAKRGLNIKVVEISDYAVPNQALDGGDLDANSFQNQPYLDDQVKNRGYKIVTIAKTILLPMGIYSKKIKHLNELRDGAAVGVPNDPTNEARALKVLQSAKLIKLRTNSYTAGVGDISENPKHLQIRELVAAQTPRSLDDLDAACINGNYAATAGLRPNRDAIYAEGGSVGEAARSPYSNILVVRTGDRNAPWAKELVSLYHSNAIRGYILRAFGGTIYPAF
jgi:D-methionine transport system substrate-binding protein